MNLQTTTYRRSRYLLLVLLLSVLLCSCGKSKVSEAVLKAPFTDASWDLTIEELLAKEGEPLTTYPSVYNGTVYTFPKEYNGHSGTIKYMYNDNDKLMCTAWVYAAADIEDLAAVYNEIHDQLISELGESGSDSKGVNNYGDIWRLGTGNILISSVTTSDSIALQYSYLHPSVSH